MNQRKAFFNVAVFLAVTFSLNAAHAGIQYHRWTKSEILTDDLTSILTAIKEKSQLPLNESQFLLFEQRDLATSRFKTYLQMGAGGVQINGALIRTWADLTTGKIIQLEAHIEDNQNSLQRLMNLNRAKIPVRGLKTYVKKLDNSAIINSTVRLHNEDRQVKNVEFVDQWDASDLQRVLTVTGRRGVHTVTVSHISGRVLSHTYAEHPQADFEAFVFPIYEQPEKSKKLQGRVPAKLKYLDSTRRHSQSDVYAPLRNRQYFWDMIDPIKGESQKGRAEGYWTPGWLLRQAFALFENLPIIPNNFENKLFLSGQYATINIHPDAANAFQDLNFSLASSPQLTFMWKASTFVGENGIETERWEIIPRAALLGRGITSQEDLLSRPARRLADHNPSEYINDGFDEIQVYYAINQLMDSLHAMGFADPELSTRPFHAILYDPDISMRDNAYYTNDTINFTTYSPDSLNYARDNPTIWHELGHGIMDRLMGDMITLADSGGLSEGMADFLAQLVVLDVTGGEAFDGSADFRIMNHIGFHLTNESHDDGEAYGGAMNDMLTQAWQLHGRAGLAKFTDLTLEAMRLTRNHPALTANDWFEHMLYADELGRPGLRARGELRGFILEALRTRNYRFDRGPVAKVPVMINETSELTDKNLGSRYNPYTHSLKEEEKATYNLNVGVVASSAYEFRYPVTIEVGLNGGPLQGALRWENENQAPFVTQLNTAEEFAQFSLTALSGCDFVNREDGGCSDFAYIQVYNSGDTRPVAKKRFYIRLLK